LTRLSYALLFALALTAQAEAESIHRSGPSERRFDLVLLAEGYQSGDRAKFDRDAGAVLAALKQKEPFKTYLGLINVHKGFRASQGKGLKRPSLTNYGTARIGRSTMVRASNTMKIMEDASAFATQTDRILVICQGSLKGGTSTGLIAYVVARPGFATVAMHEMGHQLGGLADEYVAISRARRLTRNIPMEGSDYVGRVRAWLRKVLKNKKNVSAV